MPENCYRIKANERYDGPVFDEYCIDQARYLPADRDRTPCLSCPLQNLCQAGFEEQVARVLQGQSPSLTEGCAVDPSKLEGERLLSGLTSAQIAFVRKRIPNL